MKKEDFFYNLKNITMTITIHPFLWVWPEILLYNNIWMLEIGPIAIDITTLNY